MSPPFVEHVNHLEIRLPIEPSQKLKEKEKKHYLLCCQMSVEVGYVVLTLGFVDIVCVGSCDM